MKYFLKPTAPKIIICVVFIIASSFIMKTDTQCNNTQLDGVICKEVVVNGIGYPMFYGEGFSGDAIDIEFKTINFIFNILIYYSLSSIIFASLRINKLKSQ